LIIQQLSQQPDKSISIPALKSILPNSSKFDIYDLESAVLNQKTMTAVKICRRLRAMQSKEVNLLIWSLWQNTRILYHLQNSHNTKETLNSLKVPFFKHKIYLAAFRRFQPHSLAKAIEHIQLIDASAKSNSTENIWIQIERLIFLLTNKEQQMLPLPG
jgi:DNA polymerase-3 subunit delta